ncbi:MAG TPA: hypothetical protein VMM76_01155 [Pirellulaceae bacterium]|nr:hypothetical protein [Pirellulaceae bacterium]
MPLRTCGCALAVAMFTFYQLSLWSALAKADEASYWTDESVDDVLQFVQDPGAAADAAEPQLQPPPPTRLVRVQPAAVRRSRFRLASVPNMLGDTFPSAGQIFSGSPSPTVAADIGLAGGARRMKIAENNKALPADRVFFMYNHFNNALAADGDLATSDRQRFSVERFTIGLEKTFGCGLWSVDVRMPFTNEFDFTSPNLDVNGGPIGNLAISIKRLLYETDNGAISAGLGIDTPTGSDFNVSVFARPYTVHNDAVLLMPYLGLTATPDDNTFVHIFAQLDIPANGNRIEFVGLGGPTPLGILNDQTLLYLDASLGRWLYRDPCADYLTGLAALVELHYTSTLNDTDIVGGLPDVAFLESANRRDILNLTFGLHGQLTSNTDVRVGAVFPLRNKPDRLFDSEVQVQVNRRF